MKMMLIVTNDEFSGKIMALMIENGYQATVIASTGEFLQYGDTILMLGIDESEIESVHNLLEHHEEESPRGKKKFIGKVSIFVLAVNHYVKIQSESQCKL